MAKIVKNRPSKSITTQSISAFLGLLIDSDHDASLKNLLKKYNAPDQQCKLLRVLQDVRVA
ncbi:MAG: hypothetical protein ACREJN_07580 [Nitrospiraceae bacterium]